MLEQAERAPGAAWVETATRWAPILVGAVLLAAYVRTLLPGAAGGDAGEMQFAGPLLALPHPTGMPLYVLVGAVWSWLVPLGTVAWRMNLLAAASGAAAAACVTWGVARWAAANGSTPVASHMIGAAAGLALGLGGAFWSQAVIGDKYAFAALMTAVPVSIGLIWATIRRSGPSNRADRWLIALSAACGLALTHHRSVLPAVVGLGVMVVWSEGRALTGRMRKKLMAVAALLVPALVLYGAFLPWLRSHDATPLSYQPTTAIEWINWLFERHVLEGQVFNFEPTQQTNSIDRLAIFANTLLDDHSPFVAILAVLGFAVLCVRQPNVGWPLLAIFVVSGGVAANFRGNERQYTYYLPSFVILAVAYGEGLRTTWGAVQRIQVSAVAKGVELTLAGATVIGSLAVQFADVYPVRRAESLTGQPLDIWRQDLKTGTMAERLAAALEDLPPSALVLGDWEQITPLWYYQRVEGRRPDLTLRYPIDQVPAQLDAQPVCLARHLPIDPSLHPTNIGAFVCLQAEPATALAQTYQPLGITLSTPEGELALELYGYRSAGTAFAAGQHTPLILAWRALGAGRADYSVSLRLLNEAWQPLWSTDIGAPVLGLYPTSRWTDGELVSDYHELSLARDLAPGRYLWAVVVYRQLPDGSFLELRDAQGNTQIVGGTVDVLPR